MGPDHDNTEVYFGLNKCEEHLLIPSRLQCLTKEFYYGLHQLALGQVMEKIQHHCCSPPGVVDQLRVHQKQGS